MPQLLSPPGSGKQRYLDDNSSEKYQLCNLLHRTVTSSPSVVFAYSIPSQYNAVIPLLTCTYFLLCQSLYSAVHDGLPTLSALRTTHLPSTTVTFNTAMPHSNTMKDCIWTENAHLKCSSLHSLLVTTYYNYQEMKNMHFTAFSFHILKKTHIKISTNTTGSLMHEAMLCTVSMIYY